MNSLDEHVKMEIENRENKEEKFDAWE